MAQLPSCWEVKGMTKLVFQRVHATTDGHVSNRRNLKCRFPSLKANPQKGCPQETHAKVAGKSVSWLHKMAGIPLNLKPKGHYFECDARGKPCHNSIQGQATGADIPHSSRGGRGQAGIATASDSHSPGKNILG